MNITFVITLPPCLREEVPCLLETTWNADSLPLQLCASPAHSFIQQQQQQNVWGYCDA